jgi:hypothetical protein
LPPALVKVIRIALDWLRNFDLHCGAAGLVKRDIRQFERPSDVAGRSLKSQAGSWVFI